MRRYPELTQGCSGQRRGHHDRMFFNSTLSTAEKDDGLFLTLVGWLLWRQGRLGGNGWGHHGQDLVRRLLDLRKENTRHQELQI